jgi:hypothetical protein
MEVTRIASLPPDLEESDFVNEFTKIVPARSKGRADAFVTAPVRVYL